MDRTSVFYGLSICLRQCLAPAVFIFLFCVFLFPQTAAAASLFLFPPSGTYQVGNNFTVSLRVSSGDDSINAAEGTLIFNPAEVKVVSISKSGSVFNLWTNDPAFSNAAGTVTFGGGTTTSYSGNAGTIMTVTFVSKASAVSQMSFSSGSVLAADGKGTNILANMNGGSYTFQPAIVIPAPSKTPGEVEQPTANPSGTPYAPVVTSTTHPDPDVWYSNNSPEFSWNVPSGITAVRMGIDQQAFSTPAKSYPADTLSKTIDTLDDGIWYFHIQFKNDAGWGAILHRKVMIDTWPPAPFDITVDNGGDPTDPTPVLRFSTTDETSGVAYYELRIGQDQPARITPDQTKDGAKVPVQAPGTHTVIIKAYDLAQNATTATVDMTIKPLDAPAIGPLPQSMRDGDLLIIKGSTKYQQAKVQVFTVKDGEAPIEQEAIAGPDGNWVLVYTKSVTKGAYQIWAQVQDFRGAISLESNKITLAVLPPAVARIGAIVVDYFGAIMTVIGIIIIIAVLICGVFFAIAKTRRRLRSRTEKLSKKVYVAFNALRQELREQIEYLDGKPGLTDSEKKVAEKLKEALDDSERFIAKEIKKIEKDLK